MVIFFCEEDLISYFVLNGKIEMNYWVCVVDICSFWNNLKEYVKFSEFENCFFLCYYVF